MSVIEADPPEVLTDDPVEPSDTKSGRTGLAHYAISIPFYGLHVAAIVLPFYTDFAWKWVGLAVALFYLRMFAVTAGYHRYFSHRTFKTSRAFQFVLAWLGTMSFQKGVLWWAAHHRAHHRFSDQEDDIHSPTLRGIVWAHVGWILSPNYEKTDWDRIRDFARFPELVWLNKYHLVPGVLLCVVLFLAGGMPALVWGGFVSTVVLWHATFTINSLSHVFGKIRYKTTDTSKNNWALALLTMGEGWHNNHHYYQASANQGFFWWEIDLSFYVLRGLEKVGIVWGVKTPPRSVIEGNRIAAAG